MNQTEKEKEAGTPAGNGGKFWKIFDFASQAVANFRQTPGGTPDTPDPDQEPQSFMKQYGVFVAVALMALTAWLIFKKR